MIRQDALFEDLQALLNPENSEEFNDGVTSAIAVFKQHAPIFSIGQVLNHVLLGKIRVEHMTEQWVEDAHKYVRIYTVEKVIPDKDPFDTPYEKTWEFSEEQLLQNPIVAKSLDAPAIRNAEKALLRKRLGYIWA